MNVGPPSRVDPDPKAANPDSTKAANPDSTSEAAAAGPGPVGKPATAKPASAGKTESAKGDADRLVWIDCEMTGLDIRRDALIEVAVLVTDSQLNILGDGLDLVMAAPDEALQGMADVVREMHLQSGLLEAVRQTTRTVQEAEQQLLDFVRQWVPDRARAPLCGNSIATDRAFLARDMPVLEDWLHYRIVDVSSIKELCRRWYPTVYYHAPEKRGGHRALADITESIAELRYYRETIFVPLPGPGAEAARKAGGRTPAADPPRVSEPGVAPPAG